MGILVVVIVSSGEKSTVTLEPGSTVTFVSTGTGELVASNGGKSIFSVVPKALDFFRVQSGEALSSPTGARGESFCCCW